jgi:FtsZ-binding cell division protein ZapB
VQWHLSSTFFAFPEKKFSIAFDILLFSTIYQQECEELSKKVAELTTENNALRTELNQLKKACEDMEAQNTRLMVSTRPSTHTLPFIEMRNGNFFLGTCPLGILTL